MSKMQHAAVIRGSTTPNSFPKDLKETVQNASLLVVGAGGIGCELLKNLVLTGFVNIHVIDLDTIDVSNLNRQFLFHKKHVSLSKAEVACESVRRLIPGPNANITASHDTVMNPKYNTDFFRQYDLVLNALDNKAARSHVNRLCLASNVTLIESGTAGYLGQVTVIKKVVTECYECQPKPAQKTFPGCTIRNTPSEPVHCIVWAKHLFNQLFGEQDADNEVSPDTEDPELGANAGENSVKKTNGELNRKSTREWACEIEYDSKKLFNKFFEIDINYLLSMDKLWEKRKPPVPLSYDSVIETDTECAVGLADKRQWSLHECREVFDNSIKSLKSKTSLEEPLVWDKDDDVAMDFVAAATNIRAHIFHIPTKSRFDVKSMAGNIIPAIATTNAVIAGLMVMESLKILSKKFEECRTVYLNKNVKTRNRLLVPCHLDKPNPKCYVCQPKPGVVVYLDINKFTCKQLEERLCKEKFGMVAPDIEIDDGKGSIIVSSEEGETEQNADKVLSEFSVMSGTRLKCDDFLQEYQLDIIIRHKDDIEPPDTYLLEGEIPSVPVVPDENEATSSISVNQNGETGSRKRKHETDDSVNLVDKKKKLDNSTLNGGDCCREENGNDDIIVL